MKNIPEILSPVGGFDQLMAAIENGADAVYLGGELFNARMNADNFDGENMAKAISYAHVRNVKVYITMNTLLYDDELENALEYAKRVYLLGADALILQDMGLVRMIRKYIPGMKIHLSTQGSVYNLSGVIQAKEMGFERVVLARETSLEEMRIICQANLLEIEVFVHGALCMCYSGQCQLSRNMGGRSGNRGLCAQPCRLPFETDEGMSYPLSTKDIAMIDYLAELSEAGVQSIKIEGRMKSPEYVAIVTRLYRKYLDLYAQNGGYKVLESDREELRQVFSRGDFTEGYILGNPEGKLLSGILPKHQGVYVGSVYKGNKGQGLIEVSLETGKTIKMGDGIEIHNQKLSGNVVTYIKEAPNGKLIIGDLKGDIRPGELIYKITDAELMRSARDTYKNDSWESAKSLKKINIEMEFTGKLDDYPTLALCEKDKGGNVLYKTVVIGEDKGVLAINRPITKEKIGEQLEKMGDAPFRIVEMKIDIEEGLSLPISSINKLRREGVLKLVKEKSKGRTDILLDEKIKYAEGRLEKYGGFSILELYFHAIDEVKKQEIEAVLKSMKGYGLNFGECRILLPISELLLRKEKLEGIQSNWRLIPYIPNISKGKMDDYIKGNFDELVAFCRNTGIYIGNLGWIKEFKKEGIEIFGDYGLNLNNVEAENWAIEAGFSDFVPSLESFDGVQDGEWIYEGAVPLMVTEHLMNMNLTEMKRNVSLNSKFLANMGKSIVVKKGKGIDYKKIKELMETKQRNVRIFMGEEYSSM